MHYIKSDVIAQQKAIINIKNNITLSTQILTTIF